MSEIGHRACGLDGPGFKSVVDAFLESTLSVLPAAARHRSVVGGDFLNGFL